MSVANPISFVHHLSVTLGRSQDATVLSTEPRETLSKNIAWQISVDRGEFTATPVVLGTMSSIGSFWSQHKSTETLPSTPATILEDIGLHAVIKGIRVNIMDCGHYGLTPAAAVTFAAGDVVSKSTKREMSQLNKSDVRCDFSVGLELFDQSSHIWREVLPLT
jgi:hypothetical protein